MDGREGAEDRVQPLQQHHGPLPEDQGGLHPGGRPDEVRPAAGLQANGGQLWRGERRSLFEFFQNRTEVVTIFFIIILLFRLLTLYASWHSTRPPSHFHFFFKTQTHGPPSTQTCQQEKSSTFNSDLCSEVMKRFHEESRTPLTLTTRRHVGCNSVWKC